MLCSSMAVNVWRNKNRLFGTAMMSMAFYRNLWPLHRVERNYTTVIYGENDVRP
jgi:hypothetical protein